MSDGRLFLLGVDSTVRGVKCVGLILRESAKQYRKKNEIVSSRLL